MLSNIHKSEAGTSLLLVLIVMMVASVLAISLGAFVVSRLKMTELQGKEKQAYYIARSAARSMLDKIKQQDIANLKKKFPKGVTRETKLHNWCGAEDKKYKVAVRIGSKEDDKDILTLTATGIVDGVKKTVKLRAVPEGLFAGTDFKTAVVGTEKIEVKKEVLIRGRDNKDDEKQVSVYALGFNKQIKQNDFKVSSKAVIKGDTRVGLGTSAAVIKQIEGAISGQVDVKEKLTTYTLPQFPQFPDNLEPRGNLKVTQDRVISRNGKYNRIRISKGGTLTIKLGTDDRKLVIDRLSCKNGAIKIKPTVDSNQTGRVKLYIRNKLKFKQKTLINKPGEASLRSEMTAWKDLIIYYKAQGPTLQLKNNPNYTQKIVGTVYTKLANVKLTGTNSLIGHLISGGQNVQIKGSNFTPNSQEFPRLIYAPKSKVQLMTPDGVDGKDLITGAVIGGEVKVGPRFRVNLWRINSGHLPFDFKGGRKYTRVRWYE